MKPEAKETKLASGAESSTTWEVKIYQIKWENAPCKLYVTLALKWPNQKCIKHYTINKYLQ